MCVCMKLFHNSNPNVLLHYPQRHSNLKCTAHMLRTKLFVIFRLLLLSSCCLPYAEGIGNKDTPEGYAIEHGDGTITYVPPRVGGVGGNGGNSGQLQPLGEEENMTGLHHPEENKPNEWKDYEPQDLTLPYEPAQAIDFTDEQRPHGKPEILNVRGSGRDDETAGTFSFGKEEEGEKKRKERNKKDKVSSGLSGERNRIPPTIFAPPKKEQAKSWIATPAKQKKEEAPPVKAKLEEVGSNEDHDESGEISGCDIFTIGKVRIIKGGCNRNRGLLRGTVAKG